MVNVRATITPAMAKKIYYGMAPSARAALALPESLQAVLSEGGPPRPVKTERLTLRLYADDKQLIEEAAAKAGVSMSTYITMLVYFANQQQAAE